MEIRNDPCVFDGCERRRDSDLRRGLCHKHYEYLRTNDALPPRPSLKDMMLGEWRRITAVGCWEWRGCITTEGYGIHNRKYIHRLSVELFKGPTDAEHIDHLCRNRRCFNPDHLEPVSNAENVRRGAAAHVLRTGRCSYGHEMDEANTRVYVNKRGLTQRFCLACERRREASRPKRIRVNGRRITVHELCKADRDREANADAARAVRSEA